jgi:hypothetical protein
MDSEYTDKFLFEFDVLFQICDYSLDAQKLKLFNTTIKEESLCWFMGLGGNTIRNLG